MYACALKKKSCYITHRMHQQILQRWSHLLGQLLLTGQPFTQELWSGCSERNTFTLPSSSVLFNFAFLHISHLSFGNHAPVVCVCVCLCMYVYTSLHGACLMERAWSGNEKQTTRELAQLPGKRLSGLFGLVIYIDHYSMSPLLFQPGYGLWGGFEHDLMGWGVQ